MAKTNTIEILVEDVIMNKLPILLVYLALVAIVCGIVFKLLGFDLTFIFPEYPFQPQSFLNFANSILLLAIALRLIQSNHGGNE